MKKYRQQISEIDEQIIKLLEQRFYCSEKIGSYKKERNLPIFDPVREQELIENYNKLIDSPHSEEILMVLEYIIKTSKEVQEK